LISLTGFVSVGQVLAAGPLSGVCARTCAGFGSTGAGVGLRPSSPPMKKGVLSLPLPITTTFELGDCASASVASMDFQRR
jgi:hypothetical protein